MSDWLLAGCVYLSAFIGGKLLVDHLGVDPFITGWCVGAFAVILRWKVPALRGDHP